VRIPIVHCAVQSAGSMKGLVLYVKIEAACQSSHQQKHSGNR